jgi:hypothetical protein
MKGYLKPGSRGFRQPTDNTQDNSNIVNPPRFSQLGGLSSASKAVQRNDKVLKKPGATIAK